MVVDLWLMLNKLICICIHVRAHRYCHATKSDSDVIFCLQLFSKKYHVHST